MLENILDGETIFWFCALSGTGLFLIQLLLSLFGITHLDEMDHSGAEHWLWLSRHTVTGFLLFFGWTGILWKSIPLSFAAGLLAALFVRLIYRTAKALESQGTVFDIDYVVGKEAVVYQKIPQGGTGKILIHYHDITYEVEAVAQDHREIPSFTRVIIINKRDDNIAIVEGFLC